MRARLCTVLALAALLLPLVACGGSGPSASGPTPEDRRAIDELIEAFTPLDPTLTSDKQDAWLRHQREVFERLRAGGPGIGSAALEVFDRSAKSPESVRMALLELAAIHQPLEVAPLLEHMVRTYDPGTTLGLRAHAVRLLAQIAPQRAIAVLEPLLREEHHNATYPPQEILVRGWASAAHALGVSDPRILCDVAVNLFQPPDARYAAVEELGRFGGIESQQALEELLVESSADGYLRRKAAQALESFLEKDELCAVLSKVGDRETDQGFLLFLSDMLQRDCP